MTFRILYCWGSCRRGRPRCWRGQSDPGNRFIVHPGRVDTRSLSGFRDGVFYPWCSLEWSSSFFERSSVSTKSLVCFVVDCWLMDSGGTAGPCFAVAFEMKNPGVFHSFNLLMWGLLHHVVDRPFARQHYQVHEFDAISRSWILVAADVGEPRFHNRHHGSHGLLGFHYLRYAWVRSGSSPGSVEYIRFRCQSSNSYSVCQSCRHLVSRNGCLGRRNFVLGDRYGRDLGPFHLGSLLI